MNEKQNRDEQLKIIVRGREYSLSKKILCSSVPYFDKMFSSDFLESKENKVELDFDERVFESILNWIHSESLTIQMDYVVTLCDAADFLMMNEQLVEPCFSYFHENFTIEHIPIVLPQAIKVSKLINSEAIYNFICRHFLMIANTDIFLDFPVEIVEAILKLDLMIYSEYQVFDVIIKWVKKDISRRESLQQLLNCVRWYLVAAEDKKLMLKTKVDSRNCFSKLLSCCCCYFNDQNYLSDSELQELIKTRSIILPDEDWKFNRCEQSLFVSIQVKNSGNLRINIYDNELCCSPIGDFIRDDSMSLKFMHGEYISDILFDSGSLGARIDWHNKRFRWLVLDKAFETYYSQFCKLIVNFSPAQSFSIYLEDASPIDAITSSDAEFVLLEFNGEFILIGKTFYCSKLWFGIFPVVDKSWFLNHKTFPKHSFQATILDSVVYILTDDFDFIQYNMKTQSFNKQKLLVNHELYFNHLILTSHAKNDDKVILVDKISGRVYFFYTNNGLWIEKCQIMNIKLSSSSENVDKNKFTLTSSFLPMKVIKPLYSKSLIEYKLREKYCINIANNIT